MSDQNQAATLSDVMQAASPPAAAASPSAIQQRIVSIDILRGIVMILMALDHARDFFSPITFAPEDPAITTGVYFFTRWITHFCAPIFIFLSGVSAWLYADARQANRKELASFLVKRGFWLIFVEIAIVSFLWTFGFYGFPMQVIWAIGVSMILLAGLIFLPRRAIAAISLVVIFGHNLLDPLSTSDMGSLGWLWAILHVSFANPDQGIGPIGPFLFLYPLIPWFAVMALGYCMGPVFRMPAAERNKIFLSLGIGALALFLLLRGLNLYGDPQPWTEQARGGFYSFLSFLNVQKYPPSLLYLCMTLGPAFLLLILFDKGQGKAGNIIATYGKTPFLYYILHLALLHGMAALWYWISYDTTNVVFFIPSSWPEGFEPVLWKAYLGWAIGCFILYWPCKWFADYRRTHKQWWLSYL